MIFPLKLYKHKNQTQLVKVQLQFYSRKMILASPNLQRHESPKDILAIELILKGTTNTK